MTSRRKANAETRTKKTPRRRNNKRQLPKRSRPTRTLVIRGPFPRRARVTLQFVDYAYLANVGALYNTQRYNINNAANVSVTGTLYPIPGQELFELYNNYRVVRVWARFKFLNLESFPQQCMIFPSLTDLGPNYSLLYPASLQRYGKRNAMSAKTGQDQVTLTTSFSMKMLLGDPSYNFNPAYVGTTPSGAPSTKIYLNWGCLSTNNTVSGVEYEATVRLTVDLFNQDVLLN